MAPSLMQTVPLQETPELSGEVAKKLPWIQLLNTAEGASAPSSLPQSASTISSAVERAAFRFRVSGNAAFTGGTGVLAIASVRALLDHGLSGVALLDLPSAISKAGKVIEALRRDYPSAKILVQGCDVTSEGEMKLAIEQAKTELGPLDILACFAGIINCIESADMSLDAWKKMLDVNTTGCWIAAQTVGRDWIANSRPGKILFVASISGHRINFPQPQVAYNASKAALLHIKNGLAGEWAQHGIRVNSVSPGYMDTILNEGQWMAPYRMMWAKRNPMGRMGSPEELTGAVVLLCSDTAGAYMNGTDIVVDGGGLVF